MATITVEIPDSMLSRLEQIEQPIQGIILKALEQYVETKGNNLSITQTRTWQMGGSLKVAEPDPEYVVKYDNQEQVITDYANHIDDALY